jgi:hypothetical protein
MWLDENGLSVVKRFFDGFHHREEASNACLGAWASDRTMQKGDGHEHSTIDFSSASTPAEALDNIADVIVGLGNMIGSGLDHVAETYVKKVELVLAVKRYK